MDTIKPRRRWLEIGFVALFLIVLGMPLAGKLLPREGAFSLTENRRPAPLPTITLGRPGWGYSIVSFPRRFERYWNDSFAFRWYLIRAHSLAKLELGVSPSPRAVVGQNGYLFYAGGQSVDYYRGVKPFTEANLERWSDDLDARRAWLAQRGIRYLVVVAPNKETIYGEYMPPALQKVRPDSRLDQLLAHLAASRSEVEVVDLRPDLRMGKAEQRVYHKTDTHWNDAGAMIAARTILRRLHTWYPAIETGPFEGRLATHPAPGGDLARILALEDRLPEEMIEWQKAGPAISRSPVTVAGGREITSFACASCSGPRVVMNNDSFAENLAPFLAQRLPTLTLVEGSRLDMTLIERERPDVVIQEFVERGLMCPDLRGC